MNAVLHTASDHAPDSGSFRRARAAGQTLVSRATLLFAALLLGACASFSPDGGMGPVEQLSQERLGARVQWLRNDADRQAVAAQVSDLLAQPLQADAAVRVALLNNPGLQATFANLGIAESDLVRAGRLKNPLLAWTDVRNGQGDRKLERVLLFDVWSLLTMPLAHKMEQRRFEATQAQVAQEVARVALATRAAYVDAVAAAQQSRLLEQFLESARVSRELAEKMVQTGNWPKLNATRSQLFHAETVARYARARQAEHAARERLARLLGLEDGLRLVRLPDQLAEPPDTLAEGGELEALAMRQRFDVAAAKFHVQGTASALCLTRANRFVSLLELGPARIREADHPWMTGYEIELSVPLFDWGGAKVAKAEAIYMQAVSAAAQVAVDARSQVRETYFGYRNAHQLARHFRDEVVPLRQLVREEQLRRYNGMLIGVFELIADSRALIEASIASVQARQDFWLADNAMQAALIGVNGFAPGGGVRASASSGANDGAGGH